jgi:hypothetical protein
VQHFVIEVEGPNLDDFEEIELPRAPAVGDPISTRFGTCIVTRNEPAAEGSKYDGRIVCRMP